MGTVTKSEGLGRLPENITSIASLILFNSEENPYRKYVSLDNLKGKERDEIEDSSLKKKRLAGAPRTVMFGDELPAFAKVEYKYKPKAGELPKFELPSNLPNLPNVAELDWSTDDSMGGFSSIAPSDLLADLPSLPTVTIVESAMPPVPGPAASGAAPPPPPNAPPPPAGGPPPPPPPPPPPGESASQSNPAPPPPPPAPSMGDEAGPAAPAAPAASDGTSALLEAIRNRASIKLRSVDKDAPPPKKGAKGDSREDAPKAPAPSGGLDMGDILKKALQMRRRGMGGKQAEEKDAAEEEEDSEKSKKKGAPSMKPPVRPPSPSSNDSDDDDWDD